MCILAAALPTLSFGLCCGAFLLVLGVIFVFYLVTIYNSLIQLRNNIDKAWANIDVLLKQRSDLIPNLVSTVKGYMVHESQVLEKVTKLRASLMSYQSPAKKASSSEQISEGLKSIFVVAEKYPKLQANENFLKLQEQLSLIENQIADRREFYNNSVLFFNTRIKSIPAVFVATVLGMKNKEYFKISQEDAKTPEVKV